MGAPGAGPVSSYEEVRQGASSGSNAPGLSVSMMFLSATVSGGLTSSVWWSALWLCLMGLAAYLMVSTWRFYSFKDIDLRSRQPFRVVVLIGLLFAGIWFFSGPLLFALALLYMASGVFWRLQWLFRRRGSSPPPTYKEASQIS